MSGGGSEATESHFPMNFSNIVVRSIPRLIILFRYEKIFTLERLDAFGQIVPALGKEVCIQFVIATTAIGIR